MFIQAKVNAEKTLDLEKLKYIAFLYHFFRNPKYAHSHLIVSVFDQKIN